MMVSCHEVITELWDYLDGELPAERAAAISQHLAECARCYPQYRFEYAFLAAVARQRAQGPGPSTALVEKIASVVRGDAPGSRLPIAAQATAKADERRPTPRALAPFPPRGRATGLRVRTERWALAVLRTSLGLFLLLGVARLFVSGATMPAPTVLGIIAPLEAVLAALIVLGVARRWSYGAALFVHVGSLILLWGQLRDPWGAALVGLPVCGALVALYLLRDRDAWAVDAWLAMRRPPVAVR